ncbi:Forkhead-associated (FHA) domain-containing protein [Cynara cardunculus var. scolymus]|uniref:Forkhead-associated (FHA) domain-containing protein n=1 Tax=Cynara cardunculus var. scolymus TaxID=59895 RepID=A0A124SGJ2_CYNCS|nr:Forkhead-associated (FHA) domain-containing protein [Cynara cardunculus var. scolymus]
MDDNKDIQLKKIPAFTVLKNGSILKNIFLLRKPPPFSTQESTVDSSSINQEYDEEILLVGRHPQCNITLEHPSISRYHLRIHSNPSSQMLSVIDLSSVHGTWVSGKRIESGVPVKLKDGDTVRMGGSSRIYELHWVPLSQAYDVDDPFIPAVYAFKTKQDENCLCPSDDDLESLNLQKLNPLTSPYCSNLCSDDTEVEHSSPSDGNGEIFSTSLVQPSPVLFETISAIEDSDCRNKLENQSNWSENKMSDEFEQLSNETIDKDLFSVPNCSSSSRDDMEVEHSSPWKTGNESGEILSAFPVQAPLVVSETISASEISDTNLNKSDQSSMKDDLVSGASFVAIIQGKDALDQDIASDNEIDEGSEYETVNQQKIENSPVPMALCSGVNRDENGFFMPLRAEGEHVNMGCDSEQMNQTKMMDGSAFVVLFDGVGSKMNDDVICKSIISREEVDMGVKLELFDQETPKKDSVLVTLPDGIHMDQEQTFTPDISRTKEVDINLEAMHNASVSMNLFDSSDGNELEIFTPGKENNNPNACSVKSLKRRWKEDEHEQSTHCTMSKKAVNPADNEEKDIFGFSEKLFTTDGEKFVCDTFLQRSPDTILFSSLEKETKSRAMKMEGSYNSINYPQTVQKKRWTMVVDTNSLLHNESLKHLKLLQGLIGTQLFVPKIVMRELMDIKGQDDIPKKSTKKVSLALKWIDECMVDTKWWIHVDDEILHSSEAELEVLETALHLCKKITDRKIIILSNDLTLKIKAMAEGVKCEAAEEFRRSLVNPFSERFMWVGSSARGPTWSFIDDDILRQKYHGCTVNASYRLKGLKLVANF